MTSSMVSGRSSVMKDFMPELSSWKMPSHLPAAMVWKVSLSVKSMWSMSRRTPWFSSTMSQQSLITVRVRRPRKSIFRSPNSSTVPFSYWVTRGPPAMTRARGT